MFYNNDEALAHLLDVGEKAVWCCPEYVQTWPKGQKQKLSSSRAMTTQWACTVAIEVTTDDLTDP
jgi:hypothetical protein